MKIPKDFDWACFCSCCCITGDRERSLTSQRDCSCKKGFRSILELEIAPELRQFGLMLKHVGSPLSALTDRLLQEIEALEFVGQYTE